MLVHVVSTISATQHTRFATSCWAHRVWTTTVMVVLNDDHLHTAVPDELDHRSIVSMTWNALISRLNAVGLAAGGKTQVVLRCALSLTAQVDTQTRHLRFATLQPATVRIMLCNFGL